jgi:hypothetical protein
VRSGQSHYRIPPATVSAQTAHATKSLLTVLLLSFISSWWFSVSEHVNWKHSHYLYAYRFLFYTHHFGVRHLVLESLIYRIFLELGTGGCSYSGSILGNKLILRYIYLYISGVINVWQYNYGWIRKQIVLLHVHTLHELFQRKWRLISKLSGSLVSAAWLVLRMQMEETVSRYGE